MIDRKKRLKPWAAAAALASILLLGGCLRFGPQEDEMANTTNTETVQTQQQTDSADEQPAEASEGSSVDKSAAESSESEQAESSSDRESTEDNTSNSSDGKKKTKEEDEGQRVEVTVSRDDSQRIVEFDLHVLPAGYSLSGMSWEPEAEAPASADTEENEAAGTATDNEGAASADEAISGTAPTAETERIASTYVDAVAAGQAGTDGFFIDENGQRIGYRYAADQTGRAGNVRLDFRDEDGGIATWEARITLGLQEAAGPEEDADGVQE